MPRAGKFERREPQPNRRPGATPKPDFVRTALNAAELHAYYIAVLSARSLTVTVDQALKTR